MMVWGDLKEFSMNFVKYFYVIIHNYTLFIHNLYKIYTPFYLFIHYFIHNYTQLYIILSISTLFIQYLYKI